MRVRPKKQRPFRQVLFPPPEDRDSLTYPIDPSGASLVLFIRLESGLNDTAEHVAIKVRMGENLGESRRALSPSPGIRFHKEAIENRHRGVVVPPRIWYLKNVGDLPSITGFFFMLICFIPSVRPTRSLSQWLVGLDVTLECHVVASVDPRLLWFFRRYPQQAMPANGACASLPRCTEVRRRHPVTRSPSPCPCLE
jgi:hypothetical protein